MKVPALLLMSFSFSVLEIKSDDNGSDSGRTQMVPQTDIDKGFQEDINTLKSQVDFLVSTLQDFKQDYSKLKSNYDALKSDFDKATIKLNRQENVTQQLFIQNSKYSEGLDMSTNLQTILRGNVKQLNNKTKELSDELSSVTDDVDLLSKNVTSLQMKHEDIASKYKEVQKQQTSLSTALTNFKKTGNRKTDVLFLGRLSSDRRISRKTVILFDHIEVNKGSSYEQSTASFIAPSSGFYSFSVVLESSSGDVNAVLRKNNEPISYIYGHYYVNNGAKGTTTCYVHLNEGDRVWIEWTGDYATLRGYAYSEFGGHLLAYD